MAITTDIDWPDNLACVLREGYNINHVSPLMRTDLVSGRARQRRLFTSVPSVVDVQFMMNSSEAAYFEVWFKATLMDGARWFNIPILKTPIGNGPFVARFIDIYQGPTLQPTSVDHWRFTAQLELWERPVLPDDWADFPDFILMANIIDVAMNRNWPLYLPDSDGLSESFPSAMDDMG